MDLDCTRTHPACRCACPCPAAARRARPRSSTGSSQRIRAARRWSGAAAASAYAELDAAANRAANALAALGVTPGARVAVCLPNDVQLPILFLATQRLGALWVGVNRLLAPPEKAYLLRDSGARVYVTLASLTGEIEAQADLPELAHVIGLSPGAADCAWASRCAAASEARPDVASDPFAPAAIAYTSGTTGFPKGAVHSAHNLLLPGTISHLTRRVPEGTRQGAVLPLTILNLIVLEVLAPWLDGRTVVAIDRTDPVGLAEWIRSERVGAFSGVPTIFHDLLTHPEVKAADLASLVAPGVGGSDVPPEVVRLYRERFGRRVGIGYGMTEAPTAVTWSDGSVPSAPGLCGKPLPQVEIEIVDESGRAAPGRRDRRDHGARRTQRPVRRRLHADARATGASPRPRRRRCGTAATTPATSASSPRTATSTSAGAATS